MNKNNRFIKLVGLVFTLFISSNILGQFAPNSLLSHDVDYIDDIRMADLDDDGDPDMVVSLYFEDMVLYYENNEGEFIFGTIISSNVDGARHLFISDLNEDGRMDVLVTSTEELVWFKNNGEGTFEEKEVIYESPFLGGGDIVAADIDGDGDNDLIFCKAYDILVFENLSDGVFATPVELMDPSGASPGTASVTDLDGDGDLDVIGTSATNEVSIFENLGDFTFAEPSLIYNTYNFKQVRMVDLDLDGDDDLLAVSTDRVEWCENLGGSTFSTPNILTYVLEDGRKMDAEDLDGDGDKDIITVSAGPLYEGELIWFENLGGGEFAEWATLADSINGVSSLAVADIDGDGYPEIFTDGYFDIIDSDDQINGFDNVAGTISEYYSAVPLVDDPNLDLVDFNNDGNLDVLCGSLGGDNVSWFSGSEDFTFASERNFPELVANSSIYSFTDLNGDELKDFVIRYGSDLMWIENMGDGTFGPVQLVDGTDDTPVSYIIPVDSDLDGDNDILATYGTSIVLNKNDGGGVFTTSITISDDFSSVAGTTVGDLNGNGFKDIIAASNDMSGVKLSWFENNGDDSFEEEQIIIDDMTYHILSISMGDINEDGLNDILVLDEGAVLSVFFQNGDGSFEQEIIVDEGIWARRVITLDLDNDYDIDIIALFSDGDGYENKIVWYENLGGGSLADEQIIFSSSNGINDINFIDLDSDDDQDLFMLSSPNSISWFENLGNFNTQIKGEVYLDANEDGVRNLEEEGALFVQILSDPESTYSYTYADGRYFMNFDDEIEATYTIAPEELDFWEVSSDSITYSILVNEDFFGADSIDFGIFPDTLVDRLETDLTGGFPRCNTTINYWLNYNNTGSTVPSGIIHLELDDSVQYISSAVLPDSIVDQSIYWSYDSLNYFEYGSLNVQVEMPDFLSLGDTLRSVLSVSVDSLGEAVFTTTDTLEQILVCAYDPNDKISFPSGMDSLGYIPIDTEDLEYTIRFQNTGNDTAITVVIVDQLDENLDWTSFSPIASSHDMNVDIDFSGKVIFTFENIMLPDSNVNEIASHGFVKYRIDLIEDLPLGTHIYNSAKIYFDENPPIITNTVINSIDCPHQTFLSLEEASDSAVCINHETPIYLVSDKEGAYFSGIGVEENSFNPTIAGSGEHTVYLNRDGLFGCSYSDSLLITVFDLPTITFDLVDSICLSSPSILLEALPYGGDYSGIGVDGEIFDPEVAGTGTHLLHYNYEDENGCANIDSTEIKINPTFLFEFEELEICEGDSIFIFDEYRSHSDTYYDSLLTVCSCDSILIQELVTHDLPEISFNELEDETVCLGSGIIVLAGTPTDGTFSGSGISGNEFDPESAGVGTHTLYYSYEDVNSCIATDSVQISVVDCLGLPEQNQNDITVYPNPFSNYTTINFSSELTESHTVIIYNILGEEVYRNENVIGSTMEIKKEQLGVGIFILSLTNFDNEEVYSTKLMVK